MTTPSYAAGAKKKKSWRDVLPIHPAAAAYPRLDEKALADLGADIKARGLQVDIVLLLEDGEHSLLDGISRLDALEAAGFDLINDNGEFDARLGLGAGRRVRIVADVDPFELAASLNIHRRHLMPEQKRAHIAALIKANPEKSDRVLAAEAKASPTTVGKVRSTVQRGQLDKRTGADGKTRKQPVRKGAAKQPSSISRTITKAAEATASERAVAAQAQQDFGPESSPEIARKLVRLDELENTARVQASRIIGLENKIKELQDARKPVTLPDALNALLALVNSGSDDLGAALGKGKKRREFDQAVVVLRATLFEMIGLLKPAKKSEPVQTPISQQTDADIDPFEILPFLDRTTQH